MLIEQLHQSERLNHMVTYLYVPYQFLQILGYRLVGKRCDYRWYKYRPEPIGPTTSLQHFIALIFPAFICFITLAVQVILVSYLVVWYYSPQTPWRPFFSANRSPFACVALLCCLIS
jgi:hypothetical protein